MRTMEITGYEIIDTLHVGTKNVIYTARRQSDKKILILKVLNKDYPDPGEIERFKKEYQMLKYLDIEGVPKVYGLVPFKHNYAIVMEFIKEKAVKKFIDEKKLTMKLFLEIAIQLTGILANIHKKNIIHKDINPSNMVYNPESGEVKIIDFNISEFASNKTAEVLTSNLIEGTLTYISPEQTGRMARAIDYRSDFYSLGVTFYEMVLRRIPFKSVDFMELVHSHIARTPEAPARIDHHVPKPVSEIIMKLLAKMPEDRYQSLAGLRFDLKECLRQLTETGNIKPFELGEKDISERFFIPEKLYGRENELNKLMAAFQKAAAGTAEMLLVGGYSGIGKTVLVDQIHRPVLDMHGYFIFGKFDRLKRDIPYLSLIQAFQELVKQILTETEDSIAQWRQKLLAALGQTGAVITDVIPEVELIVGEQEKVPELPPTESQNRFNLTFQAFLQVFAAAGHPLVIFLDDLQWADYASLKLLELFISDTRSKHMLLLGAYRDNEVTPGHPLLSTIAEIEKAGKEISSISLKPLDQLNINQLVADTLNVEKAEADELARLCAQKTIGNPFFLKQFLHALHEKQLIRFNSEKAKWEWDMTQIPQMEITDNVVHLMTDKIRKLSQNAQEILQFAACIGSRFDLKTLAVVSGKPEHDIMGSLWEILEKGLIVSLGSYKDASAYKNRYKLLHDRVQQAAYSMIDDVKTKKLHLRIVRLMLDSMDEEELEDRLFDVMMQLNLGVDLVSTTKERIRVAELNLTAGKKAKASAAQEPALAHFKIARELLKKEKNSWQKHYNLTIALYKEAAEAAYLSGDYVLMEELVDVVLIRSQTLADKVKAYEIRIHSFTARNQLTNSLQAALNVLMLLGVEFPESPTQEDIMAALGVTMGLLKDKPIESLADLPVMTDPDKLSVMRILASMADTAYAGAPELFALMVLKMVDLSVQYGNSPAASAGYVLYAIILCGVVGDIESGYLFGKLALQLLEKFGVLEYESRTRFMANCFIRHWKENLRETIKPLVDAYQKGVVTGDLAYATYSGFHSCIYSLFAGRDLNNLEEQMGQFALAFERYKQVTTKQYHAAYHQGVENMVKGAKEPHLLKGDIYDEDEMFPRHTAVNDKGALFHARLSKMMLSLLFEEYHHGIECSGKAEQCLDGVTSSMEFSLFFFYDSLLQLAVYDELDKDKQKAVMEKVVANQEKIKTWANFASANYLHKFYLVEAERERVLDDFAAAAELYDKAIDLAEKNKYINDAALGNKLASLFYLKRNKSTIARAYMEEAHYGYGKWGAVAMLKLLKKKYSKLLTYSGSKNAVKSSSVLNTFISNSTTATTSTSADMLDISSVLKASVAISGEIVLEKLLKKMMDLAIENGGAQKGCLILQKDDKFVVEVAVDICKDAMRVLQSEAVEESDAVSLPIINYVARTGENVVLKDAAHHGKFIRDPYIKENNVKSLMCMPLLNQGKLIGILYLENNLTSDAFTQNHLETLKLLTSQMAISIENAMLYNNLEQKVNERTCELNEKNEQIISSIRYAKRIQTAILPIKEKMATVLADHFVIYLPSKIVSGDFFWFSSFGKKAFVAVADCTGHGVPGAFVSMIGNALLNKIVNENKVFTPSVILEQLHMGVRTALKQETEYGETADGMDVCLCRIDFDLNRVVFAGAKRPIYIVRDNHLTETKGDRKSIGGMQREMKRVFTDQRLEVKTGDMLYLT
ncbi:MAG: AAA family ATPase, partial [bacterium]|nr:AAA family ATPase [bacterium]